MAMGPDVTASDVSHARASSISSSGRIRTGLEVSSRTRGGADTVGALRAGGRRPGQRLQAIELPEDPITGSPDLEQVQQAAHLLALGPAEEEVVGRTCEGHVANQRRHQQVEPHLCLVLGKGGPEFRRLFLQVRVERVNVAVGVDELGCGLVPHPWDTGKVVGGIAAQRSQERVQPRPHAGPGLDTLLVVEHVVGHATAVVEHLDKRIAHELVRVPVTGHDHDLVALGRQTRGECRDHVVGLESLGIDCGDSECLDQPSYELDLLDEGLWCRWPTRLVGRREAVAERRFTPVEGHRHPGRRLVLEQLREHRDEAVNGLGLLAGSRGQLRLLQGEPSPVRKGVAVEK